MTVDRVSGQVTLQSGVLKLTATLARPPKKISYVGYGAFNSAADFSPLKIAGKQ